MWQETARVGPGIDRHTGFARGSESLDSTRVQGPDVLGVGGKLPLTRFCVGLEILQLNHRRYQRDLPLRHHRDEIVIDPGAVLDAVNPLSDELCHCLLTKDVRGYSAPQLVRPFDSRARHIWRPKRSNVPNVAVDPIPDQLDPAIPARRLSLDGRYQFCRLHLLA